MTIRELYEYAKAHNREDWEIVISVDCADSWYSADVEINEENVDFNDRAEMVFLTVCTG